MFKCIEFLMNSSYLESLSDWTQNINDESKFQFFLSNILKLIGNLFKSCSNQITTRQIKGNYVFRI